MVGRLSVVRYPLQEEVLSSLHADYLAKFVKQFRMGITMSVLSVQCSGVQHREDHPS